ncbi:hypothetical protein [Plantactinospora soyae]|uniref:Uncharacterized protein n=1 Tax=Plantactinospora soyae TaxID=1544732 RepID=A0A927MJA0_9ACTN|nr:hypothetical protein [Plantactinospora soyae]MBE1492608.1 hypothetical protein [Plantactinospora soyae]
MDEPLPGVDGRRRLPVSNVGDQVVCLFVEPFGEDFWLQPEETFVVIGGAVDPEFSVSVISDHVIVWANAGDPYEVQVVDGRSGNVLECGHGRPGEAPQAE